MVKNRSREDLSEEGLREHRFGAPLVFGPPVYPRDPSEYPVLILCDADRAIVAVNRKTGYLLYRDGLAKSELQDLDALEAKYGMEIPPGTWVWALDAIGKPVPDDWR